MADFWLANTRQYYTYTHTLPLVAQYLLFVSMGVNRKALFTHHQAFSVCFRMLPGISKVIQAVAILW